MARTGCSRETRACERSDARVRDVSDRATLGAKDMALVAAALLALALALALPAIARGVEPAVRTATVRVRQGDTLWDIARRCPGGDTDTARVVRDIRSLNALGSSNLAVGQTLDVPAETPAESVASR